MEHLKQTSETELKLSRFEIARMIAASAVEAFVRGDHSAAQAHLKDLNHVAPHADPFEIIAEAPEAELRAIA